MPLIYFLSPNRKQLAAGDKLEHVQKKEFRRRIIQNMNQLELMKRDERNSYDYNDNELVYFDTNFNPVYGETTPESNSSQSILIESIAVGPMLNKSASPELSTGNSSRVNMSPESSPTLSNSFSNAEPATNFTGIDYLLAAADIISRRDSDETSEVNTLKREMIKRRSIKITPTTPPPAKKSVHSIDSAEGPYCSNAINLVTAKNENQENNPNPHRRSRVNSDPDYQPKQRPARRPRISLPASVPTTDEMITIGSNGTQINLSEFNKIKWSSASAATRKLLSLIFSTETLATHSLTGRPSPAFHGRERPPKFQLDPSIISDVVQCVMEKSGVPERDVRGAITTKCADTTKMLRNSGQLQN